MFGIAVETKHLANNAGHALGFRFQDVVNGRGTLRHGAGEQVDGVLNGLHGVVHLMGDGGGQAAGGGKLLDLQHAALDLELLHLAQGGQVTQNGDRVRNLAALIEDFSGAGIVLDLLFQRWIPQLHGTSFALGK